MRPPTPKNIIMASPKNIIIVHAQKCNTSVSPRVRVTGKRERKARPRINLKKEGKKCASAETESGSTGSRANSWLSEIDRQSHTHTHFIDGYEHPCGCLQGGVSHAAQTAKWWVGNKYFGHAHKNLRGLSSLSLWWKGWGYFVTKAGTQSWSGSAPGASG